MAAARRRYWLFKSEPDVYSIADLERDGRTCWDGVRNYQARNLLRDTIGIGDLVLFYHSNTEPLCIAGTARVVTDGYPDASAFDPDSRYYDPKSDPENPTWYTVDIEYGTTFDPPVTREALRAEPKLSEMMVLRRGARLSVQPVTAEEWRTVLRMAGVREPA